MQLTLTNNPPSNKAPENSTVIGDIALLDMMIEDNECNNIVVDSFLSNFHIENVKNVLEKILSKLRINGTIIITDVDADIIANDLLRSDIDLETFNSIIFSFDKTRCVLTIEYIRNCLVEFGIEVTRSYIENTFFVLEGKRVVNG